MKSQLKGCQLEWVQIWQCSVCADGWSSSDQGLRLSLPLPGFGLSADWALLLESLGEGSHDRVCDGSVLQMRCLNTGSVYKWYIKDQGSSRHKRLLPICVPNPFSWREEKGRKNAPHEPQGRWQWLRMSWPFVPWLTYDKSALRFRSAAGARWTVDRACSTFWQFLSYII